MLFLATVLDLNDGLAGLVDDLERPVLHIGLDFSIGKLAADQTFRIENGVVGIHGDLVLGGITDQALRVVECNIGRGCAVSLVIGYISSAPVFIDSSRS